LGRLVESVRRDGLSLSSGVDIQVSAASFRDVRGSTSVGIIADEICFWRSEDNSRNPDREILSALRPSLLTTGGPLVAISTAYARSGVAYDAWVKHHGPDGSPRVAVARATTERMNSLADRSEIARAMEDDPSSARSEYFSEWREDVESFVSLDMVMRAVDKGVVERLPKRGIDYFGFIDPAMGNAGGDSYTLAIGHMEGEVAVLDALRECVPPFSPWGKTSEFCHDLRRYNVNRVQSDRVGGAWVEEKYKSEGVRLDATAEPKSIIYGNFLPLLNSSRVRLLDNPRMVNQLVRLKRSPGGQGRDRIDHGLHEHDDLINVAAGVCQMPAQAAARTGRLYTKFVRGGFDGARASRGHQDH
jgi:hypothetical protein